MSQGEYLKRVKDTIKSKNSNIKLIKYKNYDNLATFYCKKCNNTFSMRYSSFLGRDCRCKICENKEFKPKKTISETNPELIDWFLDGNIPYKKGPNSKALTRIKCPDCGFEEDVRIGSFVKRIAHCKNCDEDIISFPNKFLREFFKQIKDDPMIQSIKTELHPNWANGKSYDGYLKINNIEYLIEMQGGFHYQDINKYNWATQEKRDNEKLELAKLHDMILIVIDCRKSTIDYIKNSLLSSKLSSVLNLDDIDWKNIAYNMTRNYTKEICVRYNEGVKISKIAEEFKMDRGSIRKALKLGAQAGLCNYKPINATELAKKKIKLIKVSTKEEKIFDSVTELISYMRSLGFKISGGLIRDYINGYRWDYDKNGNRKKMPTPLNYNGYVFEYIV